MELSVYKAFSIVKVLFAKTFFSYPHTRMFVQAHAHKNLETTALYECQMDNRLDHDIYN